VGYWRHTGEGVSYVFWVVLFAFSRWCDNRTSSAIFTPLRTLAPAPPGIVSDEIKQGFRNARNGNYPVRSRHRHRGRSRHGRGRVPASNTSKNKTCHAGAHPSTQQPVCAEPLRSARRACPEP
jgi:hypothetical protein